MSDSREGPAEEGAVLFAPTEGEPIRSPSLHNSETNTTVHIANGETLVLSVVARGPKSDKQRVILVTPHVRAVGGDAKPAK